MTAEWVVTNQGLPVLRKTHQTILQGRFAIEKRNSSWLNTPVYAPRKNQHHSFPESGQESHSGHRSGAKNGEDHLWIFIASLIISHCPQECTDLLVLTSFPYLAMAALASCWIFSRYMWAARLLYLAGASEVVQPCWQKKAVWNQRKYSWKRANWNLDIYCRYIYTVDM